MKNKCPRILSKVNFLNVLSLWSLVFSLWSCFSGCIRLTGTAGYWKQGPQDEAPKVKQISLDTQKLVQPNTAPGDITP